MKEDTTTTAKWRRATDPGFYSILKTSIEHQLEDGDGNSYTRRFLMKGREFEVVWTDGISEIGRIRNDGSVDGVLADKVLRLEKVFDSPLLKRVAPELKRLRRSHSKSARIKTKD